MGGEKLQPSLPEGKGGTWFGGAYGYRILVQRGKTRIGNEVGLFVDPTEGKKTSVKLLRFSWTRPLMLRTGRGRENTEMGGRLTGKKVRTVTVKDE